MGKPKVTLGGDHAVRMGSFDPDSLDLCGDLGHSHPVPGATMGDYIAAWQRARARVRELEAQSKAHEHREYVAARDDVPLRLSTVFARFPEIVKRFEADPEYAKRLGGNLAIFETAWTEDRTRAQVLQELLGEATTLLMEAERELDSSDALGEWEDVAVVDRWLSDVRRWILQRKAVR